MGALYKNRWKILIGVLFLGVLGSGVGLFLSFGPPDLMAKTETPLFCASCHTMEANYEAWFNVGAHRTVKCVDCHLPHENLGVYYLWKSIDGLWDVAVYYSGRVPERIVISERQQGVVQSNCIRCHEARVARIDQGRQCWTCHRWLQHNLAGVRYRLRYCKGSYFSVAGTLRASIRALVYPAPSRESLGVHALLELVGSLRFGPDVEYLPDRNLDYTVDESKRGSFAESVRRILPCVRDEDLTPDMSGIRPKLQGPGEPQRDFIIREESGRGCAGLVNLIGIESSGLTAPPAIARHVRRLIGA